MKDPFGRTIDYLRLSVTDRCNLRCFYCMPEEGVSPLSHSDILRYEEMAIVVEQAVQEGIRNVRLTGGEPLVRKGVPELIQQLRGIDGLQDLSLTTNAVLLPLYAQPLWQAGLRRINIGLPSLDRQVYARLTRHDALDQALAGLEKAVEVGFSPIKINAVILRESNDDPLPFLQLTQRLPVEVRFIEYMPIGPAPSCRYFLPAGEFRQKLEAHGPFQAADRPNGLGPAQWYRRWPGAAGRFAMIAPVSEHFCRDCNRLRLTADGHLRPCLFSDGEFDIKPALRPIPNRQAIRELLRQAVAAKPACMPQTARDFSRGMSQIGG